MISERNVILIMHMQQLFPGVIVFGSDQEVGELMRAIDRNNMTGYFTWIGSDGWGGRTLVSKGNEAQVSRQRALLPSTTEIPLCVLVDYRLIS